MFGTTLTIPRTLEWLNARLDLRARYELRSILRGLERSCDARLVVLWASESYTKKAVVEFYGDDDVMPTTLPELTVSVPSRDVLRDRHGEQHDAVAYKIRLGGNAPTLGVMIVTAGADPGPPLFDVLEETAQAVERVVVEAAERAEAREVRASRARAARAEAEPR